MVTAGTADRCETAGVTSATGDLRGRDGSSRRIALTLEHCWHRVPGGTGRASAMTARGLAARTDVDPIGVTAWHRRRPDAPFDPRVPIRHVPLPRLGLYESWHRLRRPRVELLTGRATALVHATGGVIPPTRLPLVVTVHDLAWIHYPQYFTARGLRFFERAHQLTVAEAAMVLCPSEATRRDCLAHGIEADRLRVVPWGVESPAVDDDHVAVALARLGLGDRPFVLVVGTVEPRKNLGALVSAMARLDRGARGADLVVVGPDGWHGELAALEAQAAGRVRLMGFVDDPTLWALYRGAAVFCYPSLFEGFGMPVLEAMAAGCTVVTSSGTACEEVVGTAGATVAPDDIDGLSSAIGDLLSDPERRAELGRAAQERARSYTWSATAEATVSAYREVW